MSILPSVRPTLNLQFDKQPTPEAMLSHLKSVGATFDRGSEASETATYVDSKGVIQMAPANYPRPDYDPETGEHRGILIEEGRTNLFLRSEEIDDSYWTKNEVTIAQNNRVSPKGDISQDKIIESSNSGQHFVRRDVSVTAGNYVVSGFFQNSGRQYISIYPQNAGNAFALFDLTNGEIVKTGGANYVGSGIKKITNDIYRCHVVVNATSATSLNNVFYISNSSTNEAPVYTGNGASGVDMWGVQLESGSFPTSYIPTVTSAVNRSADECSISGTSFSDFYNKTESTFYIQFYKKPGYTSTLLRINDNNYRPFLINDTDQIIYDLRSAGGGVVTTSYDLSLGVNKYAISIKDNSQIISFNGLSVEYSASLVLLDTLGAPLNIGMRESSEYLNDHIKRLLYFPKALTDTELENLTRNL